MGRPVEVAPLPDPSRTLAVAWLCSVLLHAGLIWLLSAAGSSVQPIAPIRIEILDAPKLHEPPRSAPAAPSAPAEAPPPPPAAELPKAPQSQIVAPPEGPEAIPDRPRFLSEKNSRAEEETVKRGQPAPPAEPPRSAGRSEPPGSPAAVQARRGSESGRPEGASEPADSRGPSEKSSVRELPGLASLFARPSELLADPRFGDPAGSEGSSLERRDLASLSRPHLWAEPGERGTPDYLPDVRQGSFTLLNTKADLFAPFVRRVGLRVFQTFSMDFKRRIFAGRVPAGREKVEVEAVMSPKGRRLQVVLRSRDGNLATDRVLLDALTEDVFFDENPPPKAVAEDGQIHFVFAIDAAVWYGRRDPAGPIEPGAQWLFGAGLL
jgi:hypothetical protein